MKDELQIEFVKDYSRFIDEVAHLWNEEWGLESDTSDMERKLQCVRKKANKNGVPFIIIAIINDNLAGTASAFKNDLDSKPELTPWLAAVVTKKEYRGLGVAEQLTNAVISECKSLGYERMYLRTEKADEYFLRLGWTLVADTRDENGAATRIFDMQLGK